MAALRAASASPWYSGSSLPTMLLDHSNILWRSSGGTPSSSAMTRSGSSAEIWVTKSASPFSMTSSMMSSVERWMLSSRSRTVRGVNPLFTSRR